MSNKSWWQSLLFRRIIISFLILAQIGAVLYTAISQSAASGWLNLAFRVIGILTVLQIVNKKSKPGYRMVWVVIILIAPVLGVSFYVMYIAQTGTKRLNRKVREIEFKAQPALALNPSCYDAAAEACTTHTAGLNYLHNFTRFPVCDKTQARYFSPGEKFFEQLLIDLERAESYIFMEYFILNQGEMWDRIEEILLRKVALGVDVRILYDDFGCFLTLPSDFAQELERKGIKATVFAPFTPFVSAMQNNRNHRKICAIDGKVAYTGGINIADEYINHIERFGHWKDSALRIEGHAAWNMTVLFLEQWELARHESEDYTKLYPWHTKECEIESDGFVLPYADSPVDDENVCEHVYLQIINSARKYLYICTPYLIIDDNIVSALALAAKSGVDVRIITPDRADKKFVHFTTQSFYRELIHAGVRIYQYTDGFIHSKTFVSDDVVATVGTANLDYRSLYLHFECGAWVYGSSAIAEIKADFLTTVEICHRIGEQEFVCSGLRRVVQEVARLFAPLM